MKRRSWSALTLLVVFLTLVMISKTRMYASVLNSLGSGIKTTGLRQAAISPSAQWLVDGKTALSNRDILTAREDFRQSVLADPNSQEAQFYYGVSRVFAIYEDGQQTPDTPALDSIKEILTLSGFDFTGGSLSVYNGTQGKAPHKGVGPSMPATGDIIAFLTSKALPEIDGAIANLELVTDTSTFSAFQPAWLKKTSGGPITIDMADVRSIKALFYAVKTDLELMRVYNLNANLPSVVNVVTSDMMKFRKLLTGNPSFLTPLDPSRLPVAKAAMGNFIDTYTDAVDSMKARIDGGVQHLFVFDEPLPLGNSTAKFDYDKLLSRLAEIKASLSGATELSIIHDANPHNIVDLSRFFNGSAPINLRFKIADCASGKIFPDPTFGGILPYGWGMKAYSFMGHENDLLGMTCSGITEPASNVDPNFLYLPDSLSTQSFNIRNDGTGNLSYTSVQMTGPDMGYFQLSKGTCSSTMPTLAPGAECSMDVSFRQSGLPSPVTSGPKIAGLVMKSNDTSHAIDSVAINGYYENGTPGSTNPPDQTLKITISGTGSVSLQTNYFNYTCSSPGCSGPIWYGSHVTINAQVDAFPGQQFTGWTGCDHYSGTECTVNMFAAKTVTAKFTNDTTKPSGSIAINSGAAATNSPNVTVTLAPKDITGSGIGYYCLSNTAITTCNWTSSFDYNATNKPWTLAGTDGVKTVYALFRDNAGNVSSTISDTILLDTTAPTGSVKINGGAAQTTSAAVTLTLAATDGTGSGVAAFSYSTDSGSTWSTPEAFVTSKQITLPSGDGSKTVQVKFTDKAGNTSGAYSASIILDTTPPTGSLLINSGADYTIKTAVTLALNATDPSGVTGVCISNTPFAAACTTWQTFAATKPWTLSPGDELKTIYVQYKDSKGNSTYPQVISDSITLDTTKPVDGSTTFTAIPSGDNTLVLNWIAAQGGDISQYNLYYSTTATPTCSGTPLLAANQLSYSHTGLSFAKTYYYRVCAVDNAGNLSTGATAKGNPTDSISPTGTVTINKSGDTYTNNKTVTLALNATDPSGVTGVCISNTPFTAACTTWQTFAATKPWTLTPGDELKTVYVQYKDSKGNSTYPQVISDSITLDTTKPVDGSTTFTVIPSGDNTLALSWSAAQSGDISQYNLYYSTSVTPTCSGTPLLAANQLSYSHSGLNAAMTYYYRVCAVDNAGNISTGATAKGNPTDSIPPTGSVTINGAPYTNKTAITLALSATDAGGVTGVCISNIPFAAACTTWQPFAATKPWTLASGDETKTVYVQYKDSKGNSTYPQEISNSITLDTTKPTGSITINGGPPSYTNDKDRKVTVNLNATDGTGSGVASYCLSNTAITTCSSWTALASYPADISGWTLSSGQGLKTVYALFKDAAGNLSAVVNAKITLDNIGPALTITTTLPDTTSLTSKEIAGTKEANADVNISLNGNSISAITQTHAGTTWKATVGTFDVGGNDIVVTATDPDGNVTTKTLTITNAPFTAADLQGTWRIVSAGVNGDSAWTRYGSMTFGASANIISGEYPLLTYISGNLTLEPTGTTGTITGGTIIQSGGVNDTLTISQGAMDINRSMLTLLVADTAGNKEMLTAVKTGSGFTLTDLVGKWYMYDVTAATPTYSSIVGLGTMVFADNGDISSGSLTDTFKSINGSTTVKTVSTFTITGYITVADDGGTGGPTTLYNNQAYWSVYNDMGQMSSQKNISIVRSSETYSGAFSNKFILVKDGGSFSTADLNGRWYIEAITNNTANFGIFGGYMDIAAGKVIGGQTRNVDNEITNITGGTLTITPAGTVTGSVITSDGTQSITAGKLDSTKSIMTIMSGDTLLIGFQQR